MKKLKQIKGWKEMINEVVCCDVMDGLKALPNESIDMLITSPPYWALRDYGVKCQFGLESTFLEYVDRLCGIFDEVKRVLKKGGTCWVNLGDTYSGAKVGNTEIHKNPNAVTNKFKKPKTYLPDKTLLQIPSRFAIEMCNRGWILRNEIIWHKKNAMPSSVLDRLTNKFEKVYLFTKSKKYYFDIDSIRIPFELLLRDNGPKRNRDKNYNSKFNKLHESKYNIPASEKKNIEIAKQNEKFGKRRHPQRDYTKNELGKNPGDIWTLTSQPYPDAHFATYPEKLLIKPIKAGCPKDGIVLDIFMGSGTTGRVAKDLNRNFIGFELNPEYCKLADKRLRQQILL